MDWMDAVRASKYETAKRVSPRGREMQRSVAGGCLIVRFADKVVAVDLDPEETAKLLDGYEDWEPV